MTKDALVIVERDGKFLLASPAEGLCVEHADLNEAYRQLAERRPGPGRRFNPTSLMPFFIKAATVALVGGFLVLAGSVGLSYALQEPVRKAGQKAGRLVVNSFNEALVAELRNLSPEEQLRIRQTLREAVPVLRPYAQDLKPLFE